MDIPALDRRTRAACDCAFRAASLRSRTTGRIPLVATERLTRHRLKTSSKVARQGFVPGKLPAAVPSMLGDAKPQRPNENGSALLQRCRSHRRKHERVQSLSPRMPMKVRASPRLGQAHRVSRARGVLDDSGPVGHTTTTTTTTCFIRNKVADPNVRHMSAAIETQLPQAGYFPNGHAPHMGDLSTI